MHIKTSDFAYQLAFYEGHSN